MHVGFVEYNGVLVLTTEKMLEGNGGYLLAKDKVVGRKGYFFGARVASRISAFWRGEVEPQVEGFLEEVDVVVVEH